MIKNTRREIESLHGITLRPDVFALLQDLYLDQRRLYTVNLLLRKLYHVKANKLLRIEWRS